MSVSALVFGLLVASGWEVPPGCPSSSTFTRWVEAFGGDPTLEHQLRISAVEGGFRLEFSATTDSGTVERRVDADTCAPLVRAAALMLAVASEPVAVAARLPVPPTPQPQRQESPRPSSPGPAPRVEERPLPAPKRRAFALGGFSAGSGIRPRPHLQADLGAGFDRDALRVELFGSHAVSGRSHAGDGEAVDVMAWGGGARVGWQWTRIRLRGAVLGSAHAHAVFGRGRGTERTWTRVQPAVAVGVVPTLEWVITPALGLGLDAAAEVNVVRPGFDVGNHDDAYRAPAAAFRAGLRITVDFRRRDDQSEHVRRPSP